MSEYRSIGCTIDGVQEPQNINFRYLACTETHGLTEETMQISSVTLAWSWFWLWCAGALTLSLYRLLHRQWFPGILLALIGIGAIVLSVLYPRALSRLAIPMQAESPDGLIVMQMSVDSLSAWIFYAGGGLIAAVALVQFPDVLWTRWLSYPAAFGALAICGLILVIALNLEIQRVLADARGVEVRSAGFPAPSSEKIAWDQVGTVKQVEVYVKKARGYGPNELTKREFVLLDRGGEELLNLEAPLDPPENYRRFLEAIPRWTGLPVQKTSVGR
jgi:hypothetical protein